MEKMNRTTLECTFAPVCPDHPFRRTQRHSAVEIAVYRNFTCKMFQRFGQQPKDRCFRVQTTETGHIFHYFAER